MRILTQNHASLFVQYTNSLSSLYKFIWRHWTYKMPVRYIVECVRVRLSIFSPLSIIQYVGLYVFGLPISVVMIERIYILCLIIIIKSEVWSITHCLGLGHETMVSAVCLSIFLSTIFAHCVNTYSIFSCDQAALWMVQSVRPSVRPSVRLLHLFDYVPIIVSSWNFQKLLPVTNVTSMQKVKVRCQRSRSQRSTPNITVSGL